ncbi:MAG: hypothetical protein HDR09_00730 [Lachnospiraceae bacterium]|nr:hypothetical protein [Lachnospiraceae bacterium]
MRNYNRNIRRSGKRRKFGPILLAAGIIAGVCSLPAESMTTLAVHDGAREYMRSTGRIQYEQAVFDSADLQDIHTHIDEKKRAAAGTLIQLGTRFRQQAAGYTYDRNPDAEQGEIDIGQIDWTTLIQAAADSQTVPDKLSVLNPEAAMHIEGVEERTDYYETAIKDNISRGKAAWADGKLLLGNGADNDKAYKQGTEDGEEGEVPENFYPIYAADGVTVEIRHMHQGNKENKDGVSGCYKNSHTTKTEVNECDAELIKTGATWYPNPDEPEGGSWHGGEYTCPYHGGLYESPGICRHRSEKQVTVWKHDIICGLEDCLYAKLTIRGTDTDYYDHAIRLEAVLEEGDGYDNLAWQEGDELVWTDAEGNVLGIGPEYTAGEVGVYRCSINVDNTDIDHREADVTVRRAGLVKRSN